jgi:hypothetical protein
MPKPGKYERLTNCPDCGGDAMLWDILLNDYAIVCKSCVGEGKLCGECYSDVDTCAGENVCWEDDPEDLFDSEEH